MRGYTLVIGARSSPAGIFGTPNYVVNGEIFWGQDRLDFVEDRIQELLAAGYKAT